MDPMSGTINYRGESTKPKVVGQVVQNFLSMSDLGKHLIGHELRCKSRETRKSPNVTRFASEDRARAARQLFARYLQNGVVSPERCKSDIRMSATPN